MDRFFFKGANAQLSAVAYGRRENPVVISVHGLRDHALGMHELLEPLSEHYYVVGMDLRGHGHSEKVATYTMIQFMADLKALYDHLGISRAKLIGHSLGGHITMRFAATYPDYVEQLVLLDGMGPPGIEQKIVPQSAQARLRQGVEFVSGITGGRRAIASHDDAKNRLKKNNPLISEKLLELIVTEGTESHPDGGVRWRWESAVNMIWYTFSQAETEAVIPLITCPVLIVTGDRGLDYWIAMNAEMNKPQFYEQELRRREALFQNAQHIVISNAGHMLHYDQPGVVFLQLERFL